MGANTVLGQRALVMLMTNPNTRRVHAVRGHKGELSDPVALCGTLERGTGWEFAIYPSVPSYQAIEVRRWCLDCLQSLTESAMQTVLSAARRKGGAS